MSKAHDHLHGKSEDEQYLWKLRHTAEHLLHQAVKELYPDILLAMGPATEDGFYFDFDASPEGKPAVKISDADFPAIEKRMSELVKANLPIVQQEISVEEGRKLFAGNPYKLEWLDEIEKKGEKATVYWTGEPNAAGSMVDLCAGPHVEKTGEVKAFKLLSVAGAYWHGDEKNKMLTRIYGTAFVTQAELDEHLQRLEEAKRRDHRKLGEELGLFTFSELVGKGLPLWTPKGATVRRELERYIVDEELKRGYLHVNTPDIARLDLYRTSGHYPYYKETMYAPIEIDEDEFMLRPMTCPHHFELYKAQPRSYKELPMRIAELAQLYRYEKSGELTGLLRVRSFCLADAHIVTPKEHAGQEINAVMDLIEDICRTFGLEPDRDYRFRLSLGDRANDTKYFQDDAMWEIAEDQLRQVLKARSAPYYEAPDEAAFYGPKIDIQMKNVSGKEDTAFTVQYDFVMPKRFELEYIGADGQKHEPVVIHRSSIGAIERVMGFLIEHFAGAFPVWLAPTQVAIVPISQDHQAYARQAMAALQEKNLRVELFDEAESMQNRIRKAEAQKIPYVFVVGGKEAEAQTVSIRRRGRVDQGVHPLEEAVSAVQNARNSKTLNDELSF
jgi:threonyl-tRNA synthetase